MKRYKLGDPEQCHNQFNCIREGFQKNIKMVGFIKRSSDPSQPGRASDKKKSKIQKKKLCLYYLYNHQIWRELWRLSTCLQAENKFNIYAK